MFKSQSQSMFSQGSQGSSLFGSGGGQEKRGAALFAPNNDNEDEDEGSGG